VALYRPQAERGAVELRTADVPAGLRVTTDLVLAQTMLRNLTANALRYARTRVWIAAEAVPSGVRVMVRDDGPGLSDDVAARLASDAAARDWAGQGLGLRLCMEISRALGAGLAARVPEGGGTEFSFLLDAATTEGMESF
jgi:two-component system, sensor histidine kinase LadS